MAKDQSAFNITLEEKAATGTPGVLDQLNLPPALITFLQKNRRTIWTVIGVVAVIVTAAALYDSYRDYTLNKAALAYDQAMLLEDASKQKDALQAVVDEYGSTPSVTWARVSLAHLEQNAGNPQGAITQLTALNNELKEQDALKPLVLVNLGGLYEQDNQLDQAEQMYQQLKTTKGFEAMALSSLGRVYETMGQKDKAVEAYQQYMGLKDKGSDTAGSGRSSQDLVQSSLNRLLQ